MYSEAGNLAIRRMVVLSLVLDPRLAEAAAGARFLRQLALIIEHPYMLPSKVAPMTCAAMPRLAAQLLGA